MAQPSGHRAVVLTTLPENPTLKVTYFSLRLAFTEQAEGGNEGFIPVCEALDMGVLSMVGLKLDDPKVKGAAGVAMGDAAREPLEGGAKEKMEVPEPTGARELSEPVGYKGGSPVTEADDFKDEGPKENTEGAPPADGKEKAVVGAAADTAARDKEAAARASRFCGA